LVFDAKALDKLLEDEWYAHNWVKLELSKVCYLEMASVIYSAFPELVRAATSTITRMIDENSEPSDEFVLSFFEAATLLLGKPPVKQVYVHGQTRKRIVLFESLNAQLPVKRIIIGPGANQSDDIKFADELVVGRVPIVVSETPYIG
jgi:hypothetical protein